MFQVFWSLAFTYLWGELPNSIKYSPIQHHLYLWQSEPKHVKKHGDRIYFSFSGGLNYYTSIELLSQCLCHDKINGQVCHASTNSIGMRFMNITYWKANYPNLFLPTVNLSWEITDPIYMRAMGGSPVLSVCCLRHRQQQWTSLFVVRVNSWDKLLIWSKLSYFPGQPVT